MTEKSDTWCYITRFVCCFDALPSAKQRYQERLREVRKKFRVVLASEQAFNLGQSSLFFEQGFKELFGFKELPSKEEQKAYSAFLFSTIVEIPTDARIEQFEKSLIFWTWTMPMNSQRFFPETRDHSSCPIQGKKPRNAFGNRPGGGRRKAGCYSIFPCTSQPFVSAS